jgi:hypothetical protein
MYLVFLVGLFVASHGFVLVQCQPERPFAWVLLSIGATALVVSVIDIWLQLRR